MISIISGIVGGLLITLIWWAIWYFVVVPQKQKKMEAEIQKEAEVLKQKKLLEVKEKFLAKKNELDKEVHQRNQQLQQAENRNKQREMTLNQRQDELNRRKQETENMRNKVENQQALLDKKEEELVARQADLVNKERTKLEELSGLSAEDAKNQLIESLKDEARTNAQAYINEIIDEAKINANKEAKRIIIQSIQRVATETAVENSVTVFHIDNDEVKGRVIGREGRNIRALENATGVEIVVDDTPEAIVISAFDPVRREICRLALHQLVSDGRIHPARIEEVVVVADLSQTAVVYYQLPVLYIVQAIAQPHQAGVYHLAVRVVVVVRTLQITVRLPCVVLLAAHHIALRQEEIVVLAHLVQAGLLLVVDVVIQLSINLIQTVLHLGRCRRLCSRRSRRCSRGLCCGCCCRFSRRRGRGLILPDHLAFRVELVRTGRQVALRCPAVVHARRAAAVRRHEVVGTIDLSQAGIIFCL